ncbi:thioesterase family protein [Sphingomonas sp. BK580]|uniref:acyl-CoA thioesterase n=1 Tax=Sphingomonas sp. BK580 TaxID=2586972 RepID=UPI001612185C|nr:thioesterase family protein [Sphingomonas sp. BK580]MBB3692032.1 4-hydroxybenzoyl-CoA thioesterase [Sphingomonas sp. BK580]
MSFVSRQIVRFAHVDAAGIVFYPRYFEMLNAAVEDYFAALGASFAQMHATRRLGVPTVSLSAEFVAVSRLGDELDLALSVRRVGSSSATIGVEVSCGGEQRFRGEVVLVCMDLDRARAVPWPEDMRPR